MKQPTIYKKTLLATSILLAASATASAATSEPQVDFYGSLRLGADFVDAGTSDDAANGRDFLSRVGAKASMDLGNGLIGIAQLEYGMRGDDGVNFVQNQKAGLRQILVGVKGDFGKVTYGSQTLIWHKFVRSAYFSDALDSLRQGAIRDDDLLQWEKVSGNWKFGAGLQMEKQDGDSFDQYQLAAQYTYGDFKLQGALSADQRGDNNGNLYGVRAWYKVNDAVTVSGFYHLAEDEYDLYGGNSSGNVRLVSSKDTGNVGGSTSCHGEERTTAGVYGKWKSGANQVHARYAVNSCDIKGDIDSIKVEYIRSMSKSFKLWASFEQLDNDTTRLPSTGENMSEFQLGARFDF